MFNNDTDNQFNDVVFADITENGHGSSLVLTSEGEDVATIICAKYSCLRVFDFSAEGLKIQRTLGVYSCEDGFAFIAIDYVGLVYLFVIHITDMGIEIQHHKTPLTSINSYCVNSQFTAAVVSGTFGPGRNKLVVLDLEANLHRSYLLDDDLLCRHMAFVTKYDILVINNDCTFVGLTNVLTHKGSHLRVKPIITSPRSTTEHIWANYFAAATQIPRFFVAYDDAIKQIDFLISRVSGKVCGVGKVTDINHLLDFGDAGNVISIETSADGLSLTQTVYHHKGNYTTTATRTTSK